jgi:hypothetical protein
MCSKEGFISARTSGELSTSRQDPFSTTACIDVSRLGDLTWLATLSWQLTKKNPDFFEVVALNEALDEEFIKSKPSRDQVAEAIKGKILGWGMWTGSCERKWT